jgi:hypothetical protein
LFHSFSESDNLVLLGQFFYEYKSQLHECQIIPVCHSERS